MPNQELIVLLDISWLFPEPNTQLHTGLIIPATYGPCINSTCQGLVIGSDGSIHNVSEVPVDNSLGKRCIYFDQGQLVSGGCKEPLKFICQYDPNDLAGKLNRGCFCFNFTLT